MPNIEFGLILVLLLILGAEFVNGWTDAPNAIATVVSTRALSPRAAVLMAAILNFAGAVSGTAVAKTIGTGIVDPGAINLTTIGGAMVGIILWSTLAARWGLPTSETHALVSGLAGGALAAGGPSVLVLAGWKKVLIGLVMSSVVGLLAGMVVMVTIYLLFHKHPPRNLETRFSILQIASAGFMAFSHGSNDGQKFMGTFALALVLGNQLETFTIPLWVMIICGTTMGVATSIGGWRIIHTLGTRMTRLKSHQGFAAETAAATTIEVASRIGIPLSTTQTIATAIMGVAAVRRPAAVRWKVASEIVAAWILTFPACGMISWFTVKLLGWIL